MSQCQTVGEGLLKLVASEVSSQPLRDAEGHFPPTGHADYAKSCAIRGQLLTSAVKGTVCFAVI